MEREIRFRGKYKGDFVYGNLIIGHGSNVGLTQIENTDINDFRNWDVDTDTVGQFTGLYDKNKKEIFEGDHVNIYDTDDRSSNYGMIKYDNEVIIFVNGGFCATAPALGGNKAAVPLYMYESEAIEIIGTIHDNK